jgi:methylmalonic aciduria homocystinuria type C protein
VKNICASHVPVPYEIRWSHTMTRPGLVAFQKLAHVSGLAYYEGSCHLNIHSTYGPWVAFRAVVVLDISTQAYPGLEAETAINPYIRQDQMHPLPEEAPKIRRLCEDAGCLDAHKQALQYALQEPTDWKRWLAMRDHCLVGRSHRYSDEQLLYHYGKNPGLLYKYINQRSASAATNRPLVSS